MLNRIPSLSLPLSMILEDIGKPSPRELAKALQVTERDVRAWIKKDQAPMPVMLALYWITRWGRAAVDSEADYLAKLHAAIADSLRREVSELTARLEDLGRIADFGAANDPAPGVAVSRPELAPAAVKTIAPRNEQSRTGRTAEPAATPVSCPVEPAQPSGLPAETAGETGSTGAAGPLDSRLAVGTASTTGGAAAHTAEGGNAARRRMS